MATNTAIGASSIGHELFIVTGHFMAIDMAEWQVGNIASGLLNGLDEKMLAKMGPKDWTGDGMGWLLFFMMG